MVFQIDTMMIERSENLKDSDIGKWTFIDKESHAGPYRSRREAENAFGDVIQRKD